VSEAPLSFASIGRLRQWLRKNHARPEGAWILMAKKGIRPGIVYSDALEEAKASGRWKAAYSSDAPPRMTADVRQALERAGVLGAFRLLSPSRRLQLLYWIGEAKRAATRARRIAELLDLVRQNRLPGSQSA
jgi:uncharacterized protein YdeI (YjbR/CyaY-like superfamily)